MTGTKKGARAVVVAYLLALQFLYSWCWSSSDVLRPLFRDLYALSLSQSGIAYSTQVIGALIGGLAVGKVQHLAGHRVTLAIVAVGSGIAMALGALVDGLATLAAQRACLGLFMGAVFPVTVGLIVELFPSRQRGRLASIVDATYFVAVVALGWAAAAVIEIDWRMLFWPVGGLLVLTGMLALVLPLPPHAADRPALAPRAGELFAPGLRRQTLALTAMIAINAYGHQALVGWMTVYLRELEGVSHSGVAATLTAQYVGSIIGSFGWGVAIDRWGRRVGGWGIMAAGMCAALFVLLPQPLLAKQIAMLGFGLGFGAVASVGPWLAELYPPHLRAPATSIFQWGRFISLLAPPLTGYAAALLGLPMVMMIAAVAFLCSSLIWRAMPETYHAA